MNRRDDTDKTTDIALTGVGALAKLFGLIEPCTAITVGVIVEGIKDRRSQKASRRLECLINSLEKRVNRLEGDSKNEVDLDLLDEIVAKAISDEDEDKTEYYAALVEYYMSHTLEAYEVRLLGKALKELTVYEIKSFANFVSGGNVLKDLPKDLEMVFWARIQFLGLFHGGAVKHPQQASQVGKKFVVIYDLAVTM